MLDYYLDTEVFEQILDDYLGSLEPDREPSESSFIAYADRVDELRSLSQACRGLRDLTLPYLYQTIFVDDVGSRPGKNTARTWRQFQTFLKPCSGIPSFVQTLVIAGRRTRSFEDDTDDVIIGAPPFMGGVLDNVTALALRGLIWHHLSGENYQISLPNLHHVSLSHDVSIPPGIQDQYFNVIWLRPFLAQPHLTSVRLEELSHYATDYGRYAAERRIASLGEHRPALQLTLVRCYLQNDAIQVLMDLSLAKELILEYPSTLWSGNLLIPRSPSLESLSIMLEDIDRLSPSQIPNLRSCTGLKEPRFSRVYICKKLPWSNQLPLLYDALPESLEVLSLHSFRTYVSYVVRFLKQLAPLVPFLRRQAPHLKILNLQIYKSEPKLKKEAIKSVQQACEDLKPPLRLQFIYVSPASLMKNTSLKG